MDALSPRLRHLMIEQTSHPLISSSRENSPPLIAPEMYHTAPKPTLPPIRTDPPHLFHLLNDLSVRSPSGSVSPSDISPTQPLQRLPTVPMSAPLAADRPFFSHRPSVDLAPAPRPDLHRRHSAQPYEINPATNRIIYREFDFSPVGSRTPISRTTKACNACRSRKVRCDAGGASGETGTCSRCRESGMECIYTGMQKKRGPCPGTARPGSSLRRSSQKIISPEMSPTYADFEHIPHSAAGSGWTSSQPRPLPKSLPLRLPKSPPLSRPHPYAPEVHRKPSIVSWHPSDIPEERAQTFERDYSLKAFANVSPASLSPTLPPISSIFGGDGRSLPPLRAAIQRRDGYYHPLS